MYSTCVLSGVCVVGCVLSGVCCRVCVAGGVLPGVCCRVLPGVLPGVFCCVFCCCALVDSCSGPLLGTPLAGIDFPQQEKAQNETKLGPLLFPFLVPPLPPVPPPPDGPKFRAFFHSPVGNFTLSSLSGGLLVEFWVFLKAGALKCARLGSLVVV